MRQSTKRYVVGYLLGCAIGLSGFGDDRLETDSLAEQVTLLSKPYVESRQVVGLSVGVIKGDAAAAVHLGKTASGGQVPNDHTIYEIGSISKVFTGILLADAVVQNKVRLDQPAQELLPPGVRMPIWNENPIRLLDLSTHRSGLPRLPDNMPSLNTDNPYGDYTSKRAHQFLNGYELTRAPGSKSEYSNFAVSLLGHLLSEKPGQTYDQLLRQRIAVPLGMNETVVELSDEMRERFATPHMSVGTTTKPWTFADMPGAGGIRSSLSDMLTFAKAQIDPPDDDTGRAIELAWQQHVGGDPTMGLGWHFAGDGSSRWHNGQTGGFHSMIIVNRDLKLAVVALSNTASMEVDRLARDLIQSLAGVPMKPREFEKSIDVKPELMRRYVGKYELAPKFVFTVSVEDGKLMVGVTNQPTLQVFPRSETEWFYKIVDASLTFKLDKSGHCTSLELLQNGVRQTARRLEKP